MSEASINVTRWEAAVNKWKHPHPAITVELVLALIWVESDGDPWAVRYESNYQYFYDYKRKQSLYDKTQDRRANRAFALLLGSTEFSLQSTSFGLCQIMGAAARERGFGGKWLTELCDPDINIKFGTQHLFEWGFNYGKVTDLDEALARWNGSASYPPKVMAKLEVLK
jgi:soluble lytic murein transglycosylase-like protein